jgi:hypothetical protein
MRFTDLGNWNPNSGYLPSAVSTEDRKTLSGAISNGLTSALTWTIGKTQPDKETVESQRNKIENYVAALYGRQDAMLEILRDVPRHAGAPPMPAPMGLGTIKNYAEDVVTFWRSQPVRFQHLSTAEQRMLLKSTWRPFMAQDVERLRQELETAKRECAEATRISVGNLRERKQYWDRSAAEVLVGKQVLKEKEAKCARERQWMNSLAMAGPPRIDAQARYATAQAEFRAKAGEAFEVLAVLARAGLAVGTLGISEGAMDSSGSPSRSDSGYSRSSRSSSSSSSSGGSKVEFHSPTYNQLKSGNIGW